MHTPRVSIVMATWNRPDFLGISIQSIIDQTFTDWELIIVDDGSPDNTAEVVREWQEKDKRITYIRLEHVGRIAIVSNAALRQARGKFVAILDDDDWWTDKHKLQKQVTFLDTHPDYVGCGGAFITVDQYGAETAKVSKPQTDIAIRKVALYANPIANSTSMFRREEGGFYDETLKQFADWDFWLQIAKKGKLYNFPDHFLAYRMWDKGSSFANQKANVDAAFEIINRYKNDYPGYAMARASTTGYWLYARLPVGVRRSMNGAMSRLKKKLFSK